MKKQSNTPHIRFQNYEDEWDVEKLKNIFGTIRNAFVGTASPYYVEKGNFYLESNNVKNGKINYDSQIFINDEFYEKQKDKWLKTNDIVMVQSGHVGHTAVIPEELNNTAAHALIVFTDYMEEVDPHFLNYQFQSNGKRKELDLISTGNTIKHILASEMKNFKMDFPTVDEQSAIGSLFRTLDDLLASYKDNLANYQSIKVAMLSKMFPKVGQTVPEIRLDGFEGEWKKAKLKDVAHRVQGNDGRMDLPTLTISASGGWMNQIDRFSANIAGKEQKNYTLLKKGELSYNHGNSKLAKYGVVFELKEYEEALVPKVYHSFRVNQLADAKFIEIMFSTKIPDRELGKLVSSGARMDGLLNISFDDFMNIAIIIPTFAEQQAIGAYFSNLDNLINSYQEKISQLETLKKKLLQDMFI